MSLVESTRMPFRRILSDSDSSPRICSPWKSFSSCPGVLPAPAGLFSSKGLFPSKWSEDLKETSGCFSVRMSVTVHDCLVSKSTSCSETFVFSLPVREQTISPEVLPRSEFPSMCVITRPIRSDFSSAAEKRGTIPTIVA